MEVLEVDFRDKRLIERYDHLFEGCPNAFMQQSTYWAEVIKDLGPDKPIFLLCNDMGEDIAGLPLYLYEHELGNILTSVPQPGPLGGIFYKESTSKEKVNEIHRCLLSYAIEIAKRYHCITLTLITNPFYDDIDLYEKYLVPHFVFENFTQYIPLTKIFKGDAIILPDYNRRSNITRNLRRGKDFGYSIKFCENQEQLRNWYQIHQQRHTELGAVPLNYYLFENIFELLVPRNKAQLILVEHEGEIISGCFFIYHKKVMDVFMLSMNSEYARHGVNYVNINYSIHWAKELGTDIYNWQSSQNRAGGVYHYKKQWGSIDSTYYFVTKLLVDPGRIQEIGIDRLKQQYQWHYVVPFAVFTEGFDKKYFKKG